MTAHITLLASAAISLHGSAAFTMAVVQFSVVIVCAFFFSSSSALDPHQLELKQHYEHLAYIADFPCLHPQPKVIPVHKLFSEAQAHGKAYFPDVTVLHRCDEYTGSCTSGHACSPKTSKLVLLPFKATYLEEIGKYKKGSWQMEYHELLNHTECGCAVPAPHDSCHSNIVESHHPSSSGSTPSVLDIVASTPRRPDDEYYSPSSSTTEDHYLVSSSESNPESTTRDYLAEIFNRNGS